MTSAEMLDALYGGAKVRRPAWPAGHYVEAEGTGAARKVSQGSLIYHGAGEKLWVLTPKYDSDFNAADFELAP